mmetsp:Transcript_28391/g.70924  ORF Transcript_28391/g.70924 Transcript_28391/m.70924 type:complete len:211 (+) Transcript_28391:592-1224(+)
MADEVVRLDAHVLAVFFELGPVDGGGVLAKPPGVEVLVKTRKQEGHSFKEHSEPLDRDFFRLEGEVGKDRHHGFFLSPDDAEMGYLVEEAALDGGDPRTLHTLHHHKDRLCITSCKEIPSVERAGYDVVHVIVDGQQHHLGLIVLNHLHDVFGRSLSLDGEELQRLDGHVDGHRANVHTEVVIMTHTAPTACHCMARCRRPHSSARGSQP